MKKDKRGISGTIEAIIMVGLVIALIAVVWAVVNNLVNKNIENSESCFGIFGKITVNSRYTCYDSTAKNFQFSISRGDIEIDEIIVSVSGGGTSKSFTLNETATSIANLAPYSDSGGVKMPEKNSGLTYVFNWDAAGFSGTPDTIDIAPVISGNQCEISDSLNQIDDCSLFSG